MGKWTLDPEDGWTVYDEEGDYVGELSSFTSGGRGRLIEAHNALSAAGITRVEGLETFIKATKELADWRPDPAILFGLEPNGGMLTDFWDAWDALTETPEVGSATSWRDEAWRHDNNDGPCKCGAWHTPEVGNE